MRALVIFVARSHTVVAVTAATVLQSCIVSGLYLGIAVFVVEQGWA